MASNLTLTKEFIIDCLTRISSSTNDHDRVQIEHQLLESSKSQEFLKFAYEILLNDPEHKHKLSVAVFMKTMIKHNFTSDSITFEDRNELIKTLARIMVDSELSIRIKRLLGDCIKTSLIKSQSKTTEEAHIASLMAMLQEYIANNPNKNQMIGILLALKNTISSLQNIVYVGNFYKNYGDSLTELGMNLATFLLPEFSNLADDNSATPITPD